MDIIKTLSSAAKEDFTKNMSETISAAKEEAAHYNNDFTENMSEIKSETINAAKNAENIREQYKKQGEISLNALKLPEKINAELGGALAAKNLLYDAEKGLKTGLKGKMKQGLKGFSSEIMAKSGYTKINKLVDGVQKLIVEDSPSDKYGQALMKMSLSNGFKTYFSAKIIKVFMDKLKKTLDNEKKEPDEKTLNMIDYLNIQDLNKDLTQILTQEPSEKLSEKLSEYDVQTLDQFINNLVLMYAAIIKPNLKKKGGKEKIAYYFNFFLDKTLINVELFRQLYYDEQTKPQQIEYMPPSNMDEYDKYFLNMTINFVKSVEEYDSEEWEFIILTHFNMKNKRYNELKDKKSKSKGEKKAAEKAEKKAEAEKAEAEKAEAEKKASEKASEKAGGNTKKKITRKSSSRVSRKTRRHRRTSR
jgi:hypothetical protein